ncbi:hypothetical protein Agabi119p4_10833 [Agaricus bisporus var. burnettii]|uniref:Uncharacterized protein n=1 Tax=Agaricus bisporus var. burnettii TaxID=192524 RepID=A0A8H7C0C9_AGABI|nr:hypothetical protein Agabi119p4_10833 [Agaricus bisporus var. burnettii]
MLLQRPKDQSSNVIITIKYGGLKATQFFSKYTAQAYYKLLEDLRTLGFPFPKKSNIVFLSHGTLEFFWPMALHETSYFVANLVSRVNLPTPGQFKNEQIAMRRHLSIFSLTIREDQYYDPCSLPQIPGPQISHISPARAAPLANKQPPQAPQNAVRYHPYSRVQPPATPHSTEGHQVDQVKPVSGPVRAAETFLDEVGTALGVMGQPKSEPVEPMITQSVQQISPPYSQSHNTSQRSIQVKQEQSPKSAQLSGASASAEVSQIAASSPAQPSGTATFNSKSPVKDHSQIVPSIPNTVSPQVRNTGPGVDTSSAAYRANLMSSHPRPASAGGRPIQNIPTQNSSMGVAVANRPHSAVAAPATPVPQHPPKSNAITTPKLSASVSHHSFDPSASHGTTQQRPAQAGQSNPSPAISSPSLAQATPLPDIQQLPTDQLLQTLNTFREKVTPAIERQKHIVDELNKRKVVSVPSKISLVLSEDIEKQNAKLREIITVLRTERAKHAESMLATGKVLDEERVQRTEAESALETERAKRTEADSVLETERAKRVEAESVLEIEHAKRVEAENVLAAERTKRIEMENVLKDIERERKNPFIVPGLLEAFIQISQATTAAINHQASTKMDV